MATPCPSSPWQFVQRSMKSTSPLRESSFSIGMRLEDAIVLRPRHVGFFPTWAPSASHVIYADKASTSFDVVVGRSPSPEPVAFSLRRKQSTIRSPRLYRRPERLLYSGNIPATPTSGSESSRWPPFKWQLLQDILLGANRGASPAVFVKIRKPHRISFESFESSSVQAVSGFFGNSQAVTIVVREEMRGPLSVKPKTSALGSSLCEQAAEVPAMTMQIRTNRAVRVIISAK